MSVLTDNNVNNIKNTYVKHVALTKFSDDYLEHFGILGMKWGKKNGPPYPLSRAISTGKRLLKERKEKKEKIKEELIRENPKKLYKNRHKYTTEQIEESLKRIRTLNSLRDEKKKRGNYIKDKIDFINGYLKSAGNTLGNIDTIRRKIESLKTMRDQEDTKALVRLKSKKDAEANIKLSEYNKKNVKLAELEDKIEARKKEKKEFDDEISKLRKLIDKLEDEHKKKEKDD